MNIAKSYEAVVAIGDTRVVATVKLTGEKNLHNTRHDLFHDGWELSEETEYMLPSGYIYRYVNDNFSLMNPETYDTEENE